MPFQKIEIKKLLKIVLSFPEFAVQHFFISLGLVLILDLVLAGIFFWNCCLKEKTIQPLPSLKINQQALEKISFGLNRKEAIFKQIEQKDYPDPFRGIGD